jgi:FAD/FMN-containing dehydrogenase
LPRGFFTPVTPGTKFVTLGGMVASDVHGKNHHVDGTVGRHIQGFKLRLADGSVLRCSRELEPELFRATLGGMGLTGHILEVDLKLVRVPSPYIVRESFKIPNLGEFLVALKEAGKQWPFTVGWIDTAVGGSSLGRGILFVGRWAEPAEAPAHYPKPRLTIKAPFALPSGVLNHTTIRLFNALVYGNHFKKHKKDVCDADTFFYPLDRILRWNILYGSRGVTQHQSVIPDEAGAEGIRGLLEVLRQMGVASFLTVIKDCGEEGEGLLSFPRPGMSVALDLPIRETTQEVIDRLNEHVIRCGGRIYLTKDGFTRPDHFRSMEPRLPEFLAEKRRWDPEGKLKSAQSQRLFGDDA